MKPSQVLPFRELQNIFFQTIKTGIIKSNLIAMLAGLSMALYVNDVRFLDKIGEIVLAIVGSALVIGAAGAFNNVYDRDIDFMMERTRGRPTVTGQIKTRSALLLGIGMAVVGMLALYVASPLAALFGFLGLFLYVFPYTMWTKRRTIYNTEVGSLSGAMPPRRERADAAGRQRDAPHLSANERLSGFACPLQPVVRPGQLVSRDRGIPAQRRMARAQHRRQPEMGLGQMGEADVRLFAESSYAVVRSCHRLFLDHVVVLISQLWISILRRGSRGIFLCSGTARRCARQTAGTKASLFCVLTIFPARCYL